MSLSAIRWSVLGSTAALGAICTWLSCKKEVKKDFSEEDLKPESLKKAGVIDFTSDCTEWTKYKDVTSGRPIKHLTTLITSQKEFNKYDSIFGTGRLPTQYETEALIPSMAALKELPIEPGSTINDLYSPNQNVRLDRYSVKSALLFLNWINTRTSSDCVGDEQSANCKIYRSWTKEMENEKLLNERPTAALERRLLIKWHLYTCKTKFGNVHRVLTPVDPDIEAINAKVSIPIEFSEVIIERRE